VDKGSNGQQESEELGVNMIDEKTLVLLKPDAVARGIVGEIITRFERVGLKLSAMKMIFAKKEVLEEHYYKDKEWLQEKGVGVIKNKGYPKDYDPVKAGQEIVDGLVNDMRINPVVAMIVEGHNVVEVVRKITGPTNVRDAQPGTIRGDFSHDTYDLANVSDRPIITVIHASGSVEEAKNEIKLWFTDDEIHSYDRVDASLHYRKG